MKIKIAVAKIFNWVTKTKLRKLVASFLLVLFILTPLYSIFFISKSEAAWWNDLWSYRKKITINKSQVAGELTNFPVLVSITDGNLISAAQADGDDLVFTDADGNRLSHEIESYTAGTGALVAWVKLPHLTKAKDTPSIFIMATLLALPSKTRPMFGTEISKWFSI